MMQAGSEKQALQSMLQSLQDQASRAASDASKAADQAKAQRAEAAKALAAANTELDSDRRQIESLQVINHEDYYHRPYLLTL